jgi:succinate-acetate transporter protein
VDRSVDGATERQTRPGVDTPAECASWDGLRDQVRITVRPIASPSTIGLFGLAAGTFVLAGLQLEWVPQEQGDHVAFVLIGFAFVSQLLASIVAVLARDVVVATAMCVLALTWLVTGLVLWAAPPGSTSDALGLLLIASCVTMALIGLTASFSKLVPGIVFLVASARFGLTGVYELSGDDAWKTTAGIVGLVLAALAVYAGWALLVEGATKKPLLPVGRRGPGALAVHGSLFEQVKDTPIEPGVRTQL